jgi:hypothetical protein
VLGATQNVRTLGIDTGSAYSPAALNLLLHHRLDARHQAASPPSLHRYADNLVLPVSVVSEGNEIMGKVRSHLAEVGLNLKGEDPIVDLRQGEAAETLGFQLRAKAGKLVYDLGKNAWDGLASNLDEIIREENPPR